MTQQAQAALPREGEAPLETGDHMIVNKADYLNMEVRFHFHEAEIKELESKLNQAISELNEADESDLEKSTQLGSLSQEVERLKTLLGSKQDELNAALFSMRSANTKLIKTENQLKQALTINKNRTARIAALEKKVKAAEGTVKTANKQLQDAKASYNRKYVNPDNPTIRLSYTDKNKVDRLVIIQFAQDQIHVHDPDCHYLISSQIFTKEEHYVPVFKGFPYQALLDQHSQIKDRIESAINKLAYDYRKTQDAVLVADMRGGTSASVRMKLWNAGILYAKDLDKEDVLIKISGLPGIGKRTVEKLVAASREARGLKAGKLVNVGAIGHIPKE